MNPQSSSTFSQEPNLESAMVVKFCSQSMIDRFRMSQSTMNLARQDSGEVSNKAENAKRTKIQIVLTHLWFESSVTKVQNVLGAGHAFFDKNTFLCVFAKQSPQMDTNICHPTSQKSRCAFNCKISNWFDSILPSGPNNGGTLLQQWKSGRCAFMAFASFCGFAANYFHLSNISVVSFNCLHLSNISFSLFRFLSQMRIYTFQLERKKKSLGLKLKTSYSESIFLIF